ncbi:hypothetical protein RD1_0023 [Roseobacter denitrificans OCh 114]|uniref:Uncharacterized protein n=1 Tax=Roseobacter denitrificans (strain ATCC 33942 / OCh 114) TaxID=375451 RepID=Q16E30_ROSDO|nr:hypothetical protein RD1_0023 [Roseobacter denitrificans OCh 114]
MVHGRENSPSNFTVPELNEKIQTFFTPQGAFFPPD